MKSSLSRWLAAASVITLMQVPIRVVAQQQAAETEHLHYTITDLGTLQGGTFSLAVSISNDGLVAGTSALADGTQQAVLWYGGSITDIGTPGLGGPNSAAYGVNEWGQASGLAETDVSDPNGEDFCGYGDHLICLPFIWQDGVMTPLPTLGGNNGEAGLINNWGEVAGNAENATPDSTCPPGGPQVLEEKPVVWRNGEVKELPTLPGDPDGWTFGINDKGQVAGATGICSALNQDTFVYVLSRHAVLWNRGKPIDIGGLGGNGTFGPGNIAGEVNNEGEVVGSSDLKGDKRFHAYVWKKETGIQDLGTLRGDVNSAGLGINDRGDVVGASGDATFANTRAFLWHNGRMIDLNTLISGNSPLYLIFAHGINSRGEIVGFGVDSVGDVHAFLATPSACDSAEANSFADQVPDSAVLVASRLYRWEATDRRHSSNT
jgi:probable HAF family extracellular repeat protein